MSRIGVFVCHCGTNIAATVDVEAVAEAAKVMPNVAFTTTNKYTCSDPGQQAIVEAIKEHNLDRLVIASCSPRMHEQTFRKMLAEKTDINPYMLEIANIREQCSWVHKSKEESTPKAIDLVAMAVAKVDTDKNLYTQTIPVNRKVLVVGAGIAGIQAALDVAARLENIGLQKGDLRRLIKQTCKKMQALLSAEEIADDLAEDDVALIQKIMDAAKEFAPVYDIDAIYEKVAK